MKMIVHVMCEFLVGLLPAVGPIQVLGGALHVAYKGVSALTPVYRNWLLRHGTSLLWWVRSRLLCGRLRATNYCSWVHLCAMGSETYLLKKGWMLFYSETSHDARHQAGVALQSSLVSLDVQISCPQ